ncbi:oligosaccharide flippase family protein [Neolewinella antarctica]|uniref:O-antigen/teichoic acid export membrane protein n=1 Tax=Neolewinella antarctica TaxID=442734 RepID=A0ABX0X919_9BACT|nr:oligosaccharide flippase family protein [Neolewinella antarctica]NJC25750.1 O-antigen/teichoic acid export membrane protein [Neolewinella antarctica]
MTNEFFRNAVFQVSLNLAVKGVYLFAVERVVQNTLPEGDYGLYFSLLGLGILLQVVADFGLQLYNSKELSGDRERLAVYFPYFIGLKIILGSVFFLLLLLVGKLMGYGPEAMALLVLAGAVQFFNSVVLYLRSNLSGLGRYALDGWFSVLDKVLMTVSVGGILVFAPELLTIERFAGLQLAAWGITAVALLVAVWSRLPNKLPRFERRRFAELLRGGAPFVMAVFLTVAYSRIDAVMIERLLPDGAIQANHYAAAYRLLDAMNMVGWLLAGLLIPMYARMRATGEDIKPLLKFSVRLLLVGSVCVAVPLFLTAQPVVELLYDFADQRTGLILMALALTFVAQCVNYAYGSLLSATGLIGRMNYVYAFGLLINVGGNWLLLPAHGAVGAAVMTLATQGLVSITQLFLAHRWLEIPLGAVGFLPALLFSSLLGTCGLALFLLQTPWLLSLFLLGGGGLLVAVLTGLIDLQKLKALPSQRKL